MKAGRLRIGRRNLPVSRLSLSSSGGRHEREIRERFSGGWNFMPVYFAGACVLALKFPGRFFQG